MGEKIVSIDDNVGQRTCPTSGTICVARTEVDRLITEVSDGIDELELINSDMHPARVYSKMRKLLNNINNVAYTIKCEGITEGKCPASETLGEIVDDQSAEVTSNGLKSIIRKTEN